MGTVPDIRLAVQLGFLNTKSLSMTVRVIVNESISDLSQSFGAT